MASTSFSAAFLLIRINKKLYYFYWYIFFCWCSFTHLFCSQTFLQRYSKRRGKGYLFSYASGM